MAAMKETKIKKAQPKALVLIVGAALIEKAIVSIANRGAKFDTDVQAAGLSVLAHIDQHSDVTLADRLYNAMPKGSRRNALASWMVAHGKLSLPDGEKLPAGRVFLFDKSKTTDMPSAQAVMWVEFKHTDGPVTEAFDVQKAVQTLLKRIADAKKAGRKLDGLSAVRSMASELAAYKD